MFVLGEYFLIVFTSINFLQGTDQLLNERDAKLCSSHLIGKNNFFLKKFAILLTFKSENLLS